MVATKVKKKTGRGTFPKLLIILALVTSLGMPSGQLALAQDEPGISSSEIRLGAAYPITGVPPSAFNDFYVGVNSYFEYLNASGGIYGRSVKMVYKDDKYQPAQSVNTNNELILKDKVFALFNSAPSSGTHLAMTRAVGIARRGIPDLAVTAPYSDFSDSKKYPTTFVISPNARQEAKVLLHYIKGNFPATQFNFAYEDNDLGSEFVPIWQSSGVMVGRAGGYLSSPLQTIAWRTDMAGGLIFGRHFGLSAVGTFSTASNSFPLFIRGASLSGITVDPNVNNLYANFHLPLYTDTSDPYVAFYRDIFVKYAAGKQISQQMIDGANAAYVFSQALAGIGKTPTRGKLMEYLRKNSGTLSTAAYKALDYSSGPSYGSFVQYIAKFDGSKWTRVSDYFQVDARGNSITPTEIQRLPLLPGGLPIMSADSGSNKQTITCVKGKVSKKITAVNPKCPKGYKKR